MYPGRQTLISAAKHGMLTNKQTDTQLHAKRVRLTDTDTESLTAKEIDR